MAITVVPKEEMVNQIGTKFPPGDWVEMPQERVNTFADCTEDHQFIHVDPEKAARFRKEGLSDKGPACSMCGSYCAIQVFNRSEHNLEKETENGGCGSSCG